ncbi:MAG: molybdenum ABC transporter ATP-binding protein [Oceanospirillum sp.]|nr:molybdenum ABC transporter ATP-binding protein [Oceanospirillum sp.]
MTISCRINLQRAAFCLQADFELPVNSGVTVLFGRSGCGKTSLLRAIAGLEPETVGEIRVNGQSWLNGGLAMPVHHRSLGYVFQEASLFPHLNVRSNLLFGFQRIPEHRRRISPDELIALLQLESLLDRYPAELSGGQRQRIAIAAALLTSPDLLLMDEPLAALDNTSKGEILPYLNRLCSRFSLPIIYVTHSVEEAVVLGDQMLLMEAGQIIARGAISELLHRTELPGIQGETIPNLLDAVVEPAAESALQPDSQQDLETGLMAPVTMRLKGSSQLLSVTPDRDWPVEEGEIREEARLRIEARDLILSHRRLEGTSCENQLAVRIDSISVESPQAGTCYHVTLSLAFSASDFMPDSALDLGGDSEGSVTDASVHPAQKLLLRLTQQQIHRMQLREGQDAWVLVNKISLL